MERIKLNKIAGYRNMLGLTQEEFGSKFGMSKQRYSQKERGVRAFTDYEKELIKDYLIQYIPDISIDSLFFNKEVCKSIEGG